MAEGHQHGAAPSQKQLVFHRHPKTGKAIEGQLRWGFIPHTAVSRPAIQPIHVRAEHGRRSAGFAAALFRRTP
jgi:putative SOS response-associated peptidase YedK